MESKTPSNTAMTSLGSIRQQFTNALMDSFNQALEEPGKESSLVDLSSHIDTTLERIARLKIVDNVSLGSSMIAGELQKEWQTNQIRLNHMRLVADALFYLSEDIKLWNVPQFELLTSLQVLTEGAISYLPSIIDELVLPKPLHPVISSSLLCQVTNKLLSMIDEIKLPSGIKLHSVSDGIATFVSEDEFEVKVTLTRAPPEVVETLHNLEKQISESEGETLVKKEENAVEEIEIPYFHIDIPDTRFEEVQQADKRWWWSLTELEFFPQSHEGLPFLENFQVEYLRKEFDSRMMNLANNIVANKCLKLERKLKTLSDDMLETSGPLRSSKVTSETEALKEEDMEQERSQDEIQPLELLFTMCRDTSTRFILSASRMSMKMLLSSESPFRHVCKIVVAKHMSPGLRMCFWSDVPVITDKILKGEADLSNIRSIQPFFEIGVSEEGRVLIYSSPDIPSAYADQMAELKFNVKNPNIKEIIMKSALNLSLPIIDVLFQEVKKHMNSNTGTFDFHFALLHWKDSLSMEEDSKGVFTSSGDNDALLCSPLIEFSSEDCAILSTGICLIEGKLQLELMISHDEGLKSKVQQWEESLNRIWKSMAKTPTIDKTHPHLNGLLHVAESLVQFVQWLVLHCRRKDTSLRAHSSFEHNLGSPVAISQHLFADDSMKALKGHIDISKTTGYLLKQNRVILHVTKEQRFCNLQFLLNVDEERTRMLLTVLKCDKRNLAIKFLNVIPIPQTVIQGDDTVELNDRKRKKEQSYSTGHIKRGKPNEQDGDAESQSIPRNPLTISDNELTSAAIGTIGMKPLSKRCVAWIESRIVFETIKETLTLLEVEIEEDYLFSCNTNVCYRIKLQNWNNVQTPWKTKDVPSNTDQKGLPIGFDGLTAIVIDVYCDSHWRLSIISKSLREHTANSTSDEAECFVDAKDTTQGKVELTENGASLSYTASHSIDDMFSDLKIISVQQIFLNHLQAYGYEIEKDYGSGSVSMKIQCVNLTQLILAVKRESDAEDDVWNVQFVINWKMNKVVKVSNSVFSRQSVQTHTIKSDALDTTNKSEKDSVRTRKAEMEKLNVRRQKYANEALRSREETGVCCNIQCSISVPELYLQRLEELLLNTKIDDMMSSIATMSGCLHHMQELWKTMKDNSKWRLHILPQSTAFGFDFLCRTASDVEYTMLLRFHEDLAFVRLYELNDVSKQKPLCEELCQSKDISETVLKILSQFTPT